MHLAGRPKWTRKKPKKKKMNTFIPRLGVESLVPADLSTSIRIVIVGLGAIAAVGIVIIIGISLWY